MLIKINRKQFRSLELMNRYTYHLEEVIMAYYVIKYTLPNESDVPCDYIFERTVCMYKYIYICHVN